MGQEFPVGALPHKPDLRIHANTYLWHAPRPAIGALHEKRPRSYQWEPIYVVSKTVHGSVIICTAGP